MRFFFLLFLLFSISSAAQDIIIPKGTTVTTEQIVNTGFKFTLGGTINGSGDDGIELVDSGRIFTLSGSSIIGVNDDGLDIELSGNSNAVVNLKGSILSSSDDGIDIDNVGNSSLRLKNYGLIRNSGSDGVEIDIEDNSSVKFYNFGIISGNFSDNVDIQTANSSSAYFQNDGLLAGAGDNGLELDASDASIIDALNNGTITNSADDGVNLDANDTATVNFINRGTISNSGESGIDGDSDAGATLNVINDSGRILNSGGDAIDFGANSQSLTLSGFSIIEGRIDGGGGNDTLKFNNLYVTKEVLAKLKALAAADADGSVTIFGETFRFVNFEDIQVGNVKTLDEFITLRELDGFVEAIGNAPNLRNEDLRVFLGRLNRIRSEETRNAIAANITGLNRNNYYNREALNWQSLRNRQFMHIFKNRRLGQRGFSSSGIRNLPSLMRLGQEVITEEPQDTFENLSGFFNVIGSVSRYDDRLVNGKSKSGAAILGLDTMINEHLSLGVYGGYSYSTADIDGIGSEIESHSGDLGVYGAYQNGDTFVEGSTGYRMIFYDQTREIPFLNDEAGSETEGHQFTANLRLGHDLRLASDQDFIITPQLMLSYSQLFIDDYHESGARGMNLNVDNQTAYSLRSEAGVRITKKFIGEKGWIAPSLYAAWVHEFLDDPRDVRTGFRGGNFDQFNVTTSNPDKNWILAGFSLAGSFSRFDNVTFSLNYNTELGREDIKSHSISLDCRIKL